MQFYYRIGKGGCTVLQRKCKNKVGTYMDHITVMKYYVVLLELEIIMYTLNVVERSCIFLILLVLTGVIV